MLLKGSFGFLILAQLAGPEHFEALDGWMA